MSAFNPKRNSFGFLRILFAATVIVSHTWPLGGFGPDPGLPFNNLGFIAVEGFFALSGFLIVRSASQLSVGRFLWHRALRIFPGYWVNLIVIAAIFGPLVWRSTHSLWTYFQASPPAAGFVINNFLLEQKQSNIGDELANNFFPSAWNGPLYTLPYEFACYLLIAIVLAFRVLNVKVVAALAIGAWLWVQLVHLDIAGTGVDDRQSKLVLCFLLGGLMFYLQDRMLTRAPWFALGAAAVAVGTYFTVGFDQVGLPALVYLTLWLGSVLPLHRIGVNRDFSYGLYIYGWPVQQTLVHFGATALGVVPFILLSLAISAVLAALSWYLVESRALKLKSIAVPAWMRPRPEPARE